MSVVAKKSMGENDRGYKLAMFQIKSTSKYHGKLFHKLKDAIDFARKVYPKDRSLYSIWNLKTNREVWWLDR